MFCFGYPASKGQMPQCVPDRKGPIKSKKAYVYTVRVQFIGVIKSNTYTLFFELLYYPHSRKTLMDISVKHRMIKLIIFNNFLVFLGLDPGAGPHELPVTHASTNGLLSLLSRKIYIYNTASMTIYCMTHNDWPAFNYLTFF